MITELSATLWPFYKMADLISFLFGGGGEGEEGAPQACFWDKQDNI